MLTLLKHKLLKQNLECYHAKNLYEKTLSVSNAKLRLQQVSTFKDVQEEVNVFAKCMFNLWHLFVRFHSTFRHIIFQFLCTNFIQCSTVINLGVHDYKIRVLCIHAEGFAKFLYVIRTASILKSICTEPRCSSKAEEYVSS